MAEKTRSLKNGRKIQNQIQDSKINRENLLKRKCTLSEFQNFGNQIQDVGSNIQNGGNQIQDGVWELQDG